MSTAHRPVAPGTDLREELLKRSEPEPNSGCWLWTGTVSTDGYGVMHTTEVYYRRAHRLSFEEFVHAIPKGLLVCHRCDQPLCINPDHLFLGTQADNIADKVRKGRQARGEKNNKAKLSADDVLEIRKLGADGVSKTEIARRFGVWDTNVHHILSRNTWRHLEREDGTKEAQ